MVVIPGDRVRINRAPVVTVAEAYLHHERLLEVRATTGRVWWIDPDQIRRIENTTPPAAPVPSWRQR